MSFSLSKNKQQQYYQKLGQYVVNWCKPQKVDAKKSSTFFYFYDVLYWKIPSIHERVVHIYPKMCNMVVEDLFLDTTFLQSRYIKLLCFIEHHKLVNLVKS